MINKVIFIILLEIISYIDIKKRVIPNWCCILILLNAFCTINKTTIVSNFVGAILVGTVLILIKTISKKTLGGGDIKLIISCAFFLGLEQVLWGLLIGMVAALIWSMININRNEKKVIPLGPFISVGMIMVII